MKKGLCLFLPMVITVMAVTVGCNDSTGSKAEDNVQSEIMTEVFTETPTEAQTELVTEEQANDERITLEEYNKIQTGMTYEEVVNIVGSPGTDTVTSEVAGYSMRVVSWEGNGFVGSNANVTFSNGSVSAKAQIGLK